MKKTIVFALSFYGYLLTAQLPFPKQNLDKTLKELAKTYKIPNLTVAVTNKDSIVYTFSEAPKGINDLYLIGSNTKSFTALAILQLADSSLVDIDLPVKHYLPWFSFAKPINETADNSITVRNLLNQTSGFPTQAGFFDTPTFDIAVFEKGLNEHIQSFSPANANGANFLYSNLNYTLLGLIVQKASGKTYKEYVQTHIFKPLNMNYSFANYEDALKNSLIGGYQYAFFSTFSKKTPLFSDFKVPQGYISSTANDMTKYLRAALKNTEGVGLSDKNYKNWTTPYKNGYAMGWGETKYFGQQIIQHLGLNETFNSALFFMPKQEYGIIVLANTSSIEFNATAKEAIILTLLDKPYAPHSSGENMQRVAVFSILILTFLGFLWQFFKWQKVKFATQKPKILRGLVSIIGIGLSVLPLIIIPKMNAVNLSTMSDYSPDFAYGFIGIAVFGILWALMALVWKRRI